MTAQLELTDVRADLGRREVLAGVSLKAFPGEVVGLVGPNGAGKTSLLRAALGLLRLTVGEARLGGVSVRSLSARDRAARVGYLPQDRRVAWGMAAQAIVALGRPFDPPAEAEAAAATALARVGLKGFAARSVAELSGGERARVLLARLLVTASPLLVADEPAAGLDPAAQLSVMRLFRDEAARGACVLVSLHDLGLAARACDRIVVLDAGRVVADGPPSEALSTAVLAEFFQLDGALLPTPAGLVLAADARQASRA